MNASVNSIILALACCSSLGLAEDEQSSPAPEVTTARILGNLPDGTPPPPEAPKPDYIVPAKDILETKTHEQGGRTITVRKIAPIALPPPPEAPAPPNLDDPKFQQRIAEHRQNHPEYKLLIVGATVYHSEDLPPRTLVRLGSAGRGETVSFWSSADFALLSGVSSFADSSGNATDLMMMWSVTNLKITNDLQNKPARQFVAPEIPTFPAGNATYTIAEGNPTAEALATIQSLHDLYNNEYQKLKTAYDGREQARLAREAHLKAHPPVPKNITLNYWLDLSSDQTATGGTR